MRPVVLRRAIWVVIRGAELCVEVVTGQVPARADVRFGARSRAGRAQPVRRSARAICRDEAVLMLRSRPVVGTAVSGLRVRRCCSATRVRGAAKRARLRRVRDSEVRYVEQVGGSLAYTVFGAGSCDVLLAQAWSPIDLMWDLPQLAAFLEALGAIARVIVFDGRNFGASDIIDEPGAASLEANADDFLAVLDAVSATRATVFDANTGVTGVTFAATYPQRVRSLIVSNLRSSYPEVRNMSAAQRRQRAKAWQGAEHLELSNPRLAHDPRSERGGAAPGGCLPSPRSRPGYWSGQPTST